MQIECKPNAITFDVLIEVQGTQQFHGSCRTPYVPIRYEFLIKAIIDELLISDEPINYMKAI